MLARLRQHRHARASVVATGALLAAALGSMSMIAPAGPARPPGSPPGLQALLDTPATDLPFSPALAAVSCPVERGPVKEGADADRAAVSTAVVTTSVSYLRGRAKPTSYPRNARLRGAERHIYQVTAYLTQFKLESDGDVHLVLKDSAGRNMIAEIPYGGCVPTSSRWKNAIAAARKAFTAAEHPSTSWHYVHRVVTVRGLGYFDPPHGQTGAAPDGLELHPVIGVSFR